MVNFAQTSPNTGIPVDMGVILAYLWYFSITQERLTLTEEFFSGPFEGRMAGQRAKGAGWGRAELFPRRFAGADWKELPARNLRWLGSGLQEQEW